MDKLFKKAIRNFWLYRVNRFFIFVLLSIHFSCERDDVSPNQLKLPDTFYFVKSDFIGNIQCYDTLGNQMDYISPNFIRNDFLFYDGYIYPYETIEIFKDSSVFYYYTSREIINNDDGIVFSFKDTLYFYSTEGNGSDLLFKGYIKDQILRIPAYGYKMEQIYEYGSDYSSMSTFGYPDLFALIERMNSYEYSLYEKLYIQRFELMYEKKSE